MRSRTEVLSWYSDTSGTDSWFGYYRGPTYAIFHDVPTEEQWVFLGRFDANRAAWAKNPSVPPRCGKATARKEKPSRSRPGARGRRR